MDKMKPIAGYRKDNCMQQGITIMRSILGYENPVIEQPEDLSMDNLLSLIQSWFPNHFVAVYCPKEYAAKTECWIGDTLRHIQDEFIYGFAYTVSGSKTSHFVVGLPVAYEGMQIPFILGVWNVPIR